MIHPDVPNTAERLDALLTDIARAMREAGIWSNALSDRYQWLRKEVAALEAGAREHAPRGPDGDKGHTPRPFRSWKDADAVLLSLIASPDGIECGWRYWINPRTILWLARQFDRWRAAGAPHPIDVRVIHFGSVMVEWKKGSVYVQHATIFPTGDTPPLDADLLAERRQA